MTTTRFADGSRCGRGVEDRVLATAQQIVNSLSTAQEVREDMLLIFSTFDNRLSGITDLIKSEGSNNNNDEEVLQRFQDAEQFILGWDASLSTGSSRHFNSVFDSQADVFEYFSALGEIICFVEQFSISPPPFDVEKSGQTLLERAENAVQLALFCFTC